ncbi:uncharacterized protein LOC132295094 [Cornus florida]|uniref:uncharacterized protein LOC132295094 n=1 Tax=Cornus florida TaxID=4283 RepID=UPI00289AB1F3|nr:uncharacterized protein LOC132295094 [Cornus florida]
MGTEVLRPQDCLIERIGVAPAVFHRRRSFYGNGNPNPSFRKPVFRQGQKKRFNYPSEPSISKRSSEDFKQNYNHHHHHVMGHVAVLRRGESLDLKMNGEDLIVYGTERSGPDPEMVRREIRVGDLRSALAAGGRSDMYAGSAFAMSPSPSSLPLPSFFNKKQVSEIADDSASRDLRRLLGLA